MNTSQGGGARVRGLRTWLARWVSDLRLGVRLAIGGGRTSKTGVARLVLSTIGIGLAVAVLLVGASAGPMFNARSQRQFSMLESTNPVPGVDPLYFRTVHTSFHGQDISGGYVHASGPRAPRPPGVDRVPGDGEIVVSEALAELLAGPDGDRLRSRFPQRVTGTIGREGVTDAGTLLFYAGDGTLDAFNAEPVQGYGSARQEMPPTLSVLLVIGAVVLLVPVFVFIATSARVAGAERDRRLAALRLVGADARQARRIAAAESLAGALTGVGFGIGLFLLFRTIVGRVPVLGVRPYPSDVAPSWPLVALIVLLVPALAVITAQVALRRTIIEPLGVVRRSRPIRRRLLWRLVPIVAGPVLLLSQGNVASRFDGSSVPVVAGAGLLLFGIPALLPWLLERAVARARGGPPAVQLAVRRLQLDSGTPARVVGGVAVVLAGAIALQTVLASETAKYWNYMPDPRLAGTAESAMLLTAEGDVADAVADRVAAVPGVRSVLMARSAYARTTDGDMISLSIVDCPTLQRYASVGRCADGDVFQVWSQSVAGKTMTLVRPDYRGIDGPSGARWIVPAQIRHVELPEHAYNLAGTMLVTPGALRGVELSGMQAQAAVLIDAGRPEVIENVQDAVGPYGWRVSVSTPSTSYGYLPDSLQLFLTIQSAILGGALFTLLLAGVSMLVLALEQMRERRRPLAALAATGVPSGTLARSLLWQNMIPVLVGVAVAVLTGLGLAALVFKLIGDPFRMSWPTVGLFSAIAAVLVMLVTVLTLPTLRSATRLAALRSE